MAIRAIKDAIVSRFNGDAELVARARAIYFGLDDTTLQTAPFVNMRIAKGDDRDTFDADIPSYTILFQIKTSDIIGDDVLETIDEMQRVFDDASIEHGAFEDATMIFAGAATADMDPDRAFDAEMTYEVATQLRVLAPVTRDA